LTKGIATESGNKDGKKARTIASPIRYRSGRS